MPLEVRVPNPALTNTQPDTVPGTQLSTPVANGMEAPATTVMNDVAAEEQKALTNNIRNPAVIKQAFATGATEDDITSYLADNGIDPDEARTMVTNTVKSQVLEAQKLGAPNEEIEAAMLRNNFNPDVVKRAIASTETPRSKYAFDPNTVPENAMDLADVYKNVHGKYSTTAKDWIGGLFSEEMALEARQEINQLNFGVVDTLNKNGIVASINPEDGEVYITRPNGAVEPLDSSLLNDLWNSKMNVTGSVAGGSLGIMGGAAAGAAVGSVVPVIGTAAGAVVGGAIGGLAGSAVGGSLGTAADLTLNAYTLKEQLSTDLYKAQMVEAGIADMTMGIALKAGIATSKTLAKGTMTAFNYVKNGNETGALAQLVDSLHMTKDQATEWVDAVKSKLTSDMTVKSHTANVLSFGKIPSKDVKMSPNQESVTTLLNTHPLAEAYVKDVAAEDHTIANSIAISVNERAKGLTRAIDTITDANTGALVRKDLNAYAKDVDSFYGLVKEQGIKHVQGTDFKFDLEKLAIEPVFKDIEKAMPPRMQERFLAYMTRIDTATVDRSFEGLINLRQAVNEFKYGVSGLTPPQLESINKVLNNIDSQISKAAKDYIPDYKAWLANFSKAKSEYAKKKILEENALFRQLTRDTGNTENSIQNLLNKFGNDKDVDLETLNPVLDRLSPRTRMLTEGAALRNLASKHTYGDATGFQAINFPELANEMRGLNAKTPEVKAVIEAINEIAKVFKNDEALAKISGSVAVRQTSTQGIATTVEGRAKSMIMTQIGRTIMARLPGKTGRNSALIKMAAEVLQDPLKTTNVEKLLKEVPEPSQPVMRSLVRELQVDTAKQNLKSGAKPSEWQNMYKQSASGKLVETDGVLGRGLYLVDKVANPKPGANIVKHEVNMTRMATLDSISKFVGKQVTEADLPLLLKNTNLREQLIEQKMLGIKLDGKAMLFPDTVRGAK